ncbi:MAG: GNAT family N-acetyltransferase [Candidatus Lernaella stagnicola]|nr:GNAT family N-acetyltransferase [Candidatus Lernaella stagnicola]
MKSAEPTLTRHPKTTAVGSLLHEVFDASVARFFTAILKHHPRRDLLREAGHLDAAGRLVSYAMMLPERFVVDGVTMDAGLLEAVATAESWRGRGLFPSIHADLLDQVADQHYPFALLFGIPTYYRRLGYAFATPFYARCRMEAYVAADLHPVPGLHRRRATAADVPRLMNLYHRSLAGKQVHFSRDRASLRTWLKHYEKAGDIETHVFTRDGRVAAYLRVNFQTTGMLVMEAGGWTAATLPAALRYLGRRAMKEDLPDFDLALPGDDPLLPAAQYWGADPVDPMLTYALQVKMLDWRRMIAALKPAFDRRLAASAFCDLTLSLPCRMDSQSFTLEIRNGRFAGVGPPHDAPVVLCLRGGRESLMRMLFGVKSVPDMLDTTPDMRCPPELRPVVSTLFPALRPYVNELDGF